MGLTAFERDGSVLWRPPQPWNEAVHALLRHLQGVGFVGAPLSFGVEADGRHKLSWVAGEPGKSGGEPTARLASSARLIHSFHQAVRGFSAPTGLQGLVGAPSVGPIVCHNDLAPGNIIFRGDTAVALIDWDLAGPGDERWDLAYAAWRSVPLYDDSFFIERDVQPPDRDHRLRVFVDAYGLTDRDDFTALICQRIDSLYQTAKLWGGEQGKAGWSDVWHHTHGQQWLGSLAYAEANADRWTNALTV